MHYTTGNQFYQRSYWDLAKRFGIVDWMKERWDDWLTKLKIQLGDNRNGIITENAITDSYFNKILN